jgi:hypothetical protein
MAIQDARDCAQAACLDLKPLVPELGSIGDAYVLIVWLIYWLSGDICLWEWRRC